LSDTAIEKLETLLWNSEVEELPYPAKAGVKTLRFWYAVLRDVIAGNLTLRAMGLVYVTILSIVPIIAIVFSILKGFGYHRQLEPLLYNFLAPLGEKGVELTNQIMGFVENVQGNVLAGVGLILLFVTALSMAEKVEDSFNHVWRVDRARSIAQRISEYFSLILMGPIVMVTALAVIAAVESNALVQNISQIEPFGRALLLFGKLMPYLLVVLGFTLAYWFLPNTRVRFSSALCGGLAGGVLWASTSVMFATFVATSARTMSIYATFAIVIIALIWIYLCWLMLLVGALVSFYWQNPEHLRVGYRPIYMGGRQREQIAFSVMAEMARAFRDGSNQPAIADVAALLKLPGILLIPVINRLVAAGLLTRSGKNQLFPKRDPNGISLQDIVNAVRDSQSTDVFPAGQWPPLVADVSGRIGTAINASLGDQTLYDFLDADASNDTANE
jgi:membrane protein